MLNKLFSKPIEMTVGDQELRFCSIPDFEFCLTGRTSVPSKKITDLVKLPPKKLKNEAVTIKDIEKRFVSILSRSIENPNNINKDLRELDPSIFSQDHNWRNIIAALNEGGDEFNPFRRVALVKYMQYLAARQEIVKYLYSEKQNMAASNKVAEDDNSDAASDKLSGTLILESTIFEPAKKGEPSDFERMPKGEVVFVRVKNGQEIDVRLSKHRCKISNKDKLVFIDQNGSASDLTMGRNVVGRDSSSNVVIDPALRDISRLHLLVENVGDDNLQLTDMSSHGTFLHQSLLQNLTQ